MSTLIFPGRFQPFHNGHLMVVQGMMKVSDNVVVVICEGKSADGNDLFSLDQRRDMIGAALLAANIMDATIAVVKDAETDEAWAHHVLDVSGNPAEPIIWSGNEDVRKIFEAKGVATKKIVPVPGIVGEDIRKMIREKNPTWRSKIPAGALDIIVDTLVK
ncbi:MAG TPA: adenylyltransferase/cytidyltransferase family protein [bacterium]|nr:adenylyltransferase/cytidyltransferase family protein [bacterium]